MYSTFVKAEVLYQAIVDRKDNSWIIIDCRYYLTDPDLGYKEYLQNHIPSAIYAHLDSDLSSPITNQTGRHPLPTINNFKIWLTENRINSSSQIVVYDQLGGGIAARLWWMLLHLGFDNVAVLEGGITKWKNDGYKMENGVYSRKHLDFEAELIIPEDWDAGRFKIFNKAEVEKIIDSKFYNLIDSRSPERYSGKLEPIDPIAGHIPSAKNVFWQSHLTDDLILISNEESQEIFNETLDPNSETVFYCGSGVTAAFNVLIMKHLGGSDPGIYIGSWSDWIRD
ncbi:MAG: sulfurtransferase [Candidatus Kariarchaeaceae archaeon]|jgi:thiosulfate/3-mercaptopyruvate sulfurtransferase